MARKTAGQVIERTGQRGTTYALRFQIAGRRHFQTLGNESDGWSRERADGELRYVMAQIERGAWTPPRDKAPAVVESRPDPGFREFASEWFAALPRTGPAALSPNTIADYEWQLTHHLVPFFARHTLSEITIQEVDRYRQTKVREGRLAATSINKTITRLAQILEVAVEYELIDRNVARGKRRRLKASSRPRTYLDRADQITALLDAAGALDAEARPDRQGIGRRALLATLTFAGLRVGELCDLRWRDVDLAGGRITIGKTKTDAGERRIDMLPLLRDELTTHRMTTRGGTSATDYVFATTTGRRRDKDNIRNRILTPAIRRADQQREQAKLAPLPERLSPHGLRHTFASILVALGEDPRYVMAQLGHTDPGFTLRLYSHSMRREDGERERLATLVRGEQMAHSGTNTVGDRDGGVFGPQTPNAKAPR